MSRVARYAKLVAHEGRGGEISEHLLSAADDLRDDAGCELYLVNRERGEPDVIWVTELWRSQSDLNASIEKIRGSEGVAALMRLTREHQMVELELLGGKGPAIETPG